MCPFHEAFSCISVQFHRHQQMKFAKLARFTKWGKTACELKGVVLQTLVNQFVSFKNSLYILHLEKGTHRNICSRGKNLSSKSPTCHLVTALSL